MNIYIYMHLNSKFNLKTINLKNIYILNFRVYYVNNAKNTNYFTKYFTNC